MILRRYLEKIYSDLTISLILTFATILIALIGLMYPDIYKTTIGMLLFVVVRFPMESYF
jgi:hypothetical protein